MPRASEDLPPFEKLTNLDDNKESFSLPLEHLVADAYILNIESAHGASQTVRFVESGF
jgi:hypothetical protein